MTLQHEMAYHSSVQLSISFRKPEQHPSSSYHHYIKSREFISCCHRDHNFKTTFASLMIYMLVKAGKKEDRKDVPQLKMLTPLQRQLSLGLARGAFEPEHNLLRRLGFLSEDRLRLTSVSGLFPVVTTLSLREEGVLEIFENHVRDRVSLALWNFVGDSK